MDNEILGNKAICKRFLTIAMYDDDGRCVEDYKDIEAGTIWDIEDDSWRLIDGEIRLTNKDLDWLEISKDTFEEYFEVIS